MQEIYNDADYVFALPFSVRKELCNILDAMNCWENLASLMPDIKVCDIEACRNAQSVSPTEVLLLIWGSKGNKVVQLYNYLAKLKHVRAMKVLHNLVDSKFHHWESQCLSLDEDERTASPITSPVPNASHVFDEVNTSPDKHEGTKILSFDLTDDIIHDLQSTISVKYSEILSITDNFSKENIIGRGGYGVVYKAVWKHIQVAVKRITSSEESKNTKFKRMKLKTLQSLQELRILNKYRHDNIIPLYGYSFDGPELVLIYQFMENKSLDDCIQLKSTNIPLNWSQRLNICHGIASALYYLHTATYNPVVHGDVKSANILIDSSFKPKLGDFALCKMEEISVNKASSEGSEFYGTYAYLSPEFLSKKIVSTKLDVFAFGVVMLELSTGQHAYCNVKRQRLAEFSRGLYLMLEDDPNEIKSIMDPKCLAENVLDFESFCALFRLGVSCIEHDASKRPSFAEILTYPLFDFSEEHELSS